MTDDLNARGLRILSDMVEQPEPRSWSEQPTDDPLAERLRIIAEAVPGLRRAGVLQLTLPDLQLTLEPAPQEAVRPRARDDDPDEDHLNPHTFTRRPAPDLDDEDGEIA